MQHTIKNKMTYYYKTMPSPVGQLKLIASSRGIAAILWQDDDPQRGGFIELTPDNKHPALLECKKQLQEYFAGKRKKFSLQLDAKGTDFQKRVWQELAKIPFGETRSYGEIAKKIGNEKASRPVGGASGRNPLPIIVPCHRVIGSSGKLTGFAGGIKVKEFLLQLEKNL